VSSAEAAQRKQNPPQQKQSRAQQNQRRGATKTKPGATKSKCLFSLIILAFQTVSARSPAILSRVMDILAGDPSVRRRRRGRSIQLSEEYADLAPPCKKYLVLRKSLRAR
jgi:hypothetical protein